MCRFIVHLVEQTYRLIESQQPIAASSMNIQSTRNSGNSAVLATVRAQQDRMTLSFAEEVDGRINVE
jgi:hypothetical protein